MTVTSQLSEAEPRPFLQYQQLNLENLGKNLKEIHAAYKQV